MNHIFFLNCYINSHHSLCTTVLWPSFPPRPPPTNTYVSTRCIFNSLVSVYNFLQETLTLHTQSSTLHDCWVTAARRKPDFQKKNAFLQDDARNAAKFPRTVPLKQTASPASSFPSKDSLGIWAELALFALNSAYKLCTPVGRKACHRIELLHTVIGQKYLCHPAATDCLGSHVHLSQTAP